MKGEAFADPKVTLQRFVIVAENGKVLRVNVEDDAPKVTVTSADSVLQF